MASAPLERPGGENIPRPAPASAGPRFAVDDWRAAPSATEWDDLARSASEPNPFYEHWALLPALERFASGQVVLATLRIGGELCGLLPLQRSARYYDYPLPHLVNWTHPNMFVGSPLVRTGNETAFWHALLSWADEHPGGALFLHVDRIADRSPLHSSLIAALRGQGRVWGEVKREERAFLHSNLSAEAYFEGSMSGKKRKELRRQHNRLSEEGDLCFERLADETRIDEWIADYLTLEKSGWKGRNGSALADDQRTREWFAHAMRGATDAGRLERLSLTLDGAPIAMLANFIAPPGAFSFKTAFDERYARFSPGVLLQRENLDLLARDDIAWCDSCAATDHPMIERIWREKRAMVRVNVAIGGKLRRALFHQLLRAELARKARSS